MVQRVSERRLNDRPRGLDENAAAGCRSRVRLETAPTETVDKRGACIMQETSHDVARRGERKKKGYSQKGSAGVERRKESRGQVESKRGQEWEDIARICISFCKFRTVYRPGLVPIVLHTTIIGICKRRSVWVPDIDFKDLLLFVDIHESRATANGDSN